MNLTEFLRLIRNHRLSHTHTECYIVHKNIICIISNDDDDDDDEEEEDDNGDE